MTMQERETIEHMLEIGEESLDPDMYADLKNIIAVLSARRKALTSSFDDSRGGRANWQHVNVPDGREGIWCNYGRHRTAEFYERDIVDEKADRMCPECFVAWFESVEGISERKDVSVRSPFGRSYISEYENENEESKICLLVEQKEKMKAALIPLIRKVNKDREHATDEEQTIEWWTELFASVSVEVVAYLYEWGSVELK